MARTSRRSPGGGDPEIVKAISTNWRLWAGLPAKVDAVLFLGNPNAPDTKDKMIAVVGRPKFPGGVCTGCGCTEFDACIVHNGGFGDEVGCSWIDEKQTRCSACGPARPAVKKAKKP